MRKKLLKAILFFDNFILINKDVINLLYCLRRLKNMEIIGPLKDDNPLFFEIERNSTITASDNNKCHVSDWEDGIYIYKNGKKKIFAD